MMAPADQAPAITPGRVAAAYLDACRIELRALKPGNVHVFADGHRMTVADFTTSAEASATALAAPDLGVGARVLQAVERTRDAVGCNTNLGILLLCAPLAAAAMEPAPGDLRRRVERVLARLSVADAEQTFAAIRRAEPAGLGESATHDVRAPARVSLLEAMRLARNRDRIAAQYADGFGDVFDFGLPRLGAGLRRWHDIRWAASSAYLGFVAGFADSHILRKHGAARAEAVRAAAAPLDEELAAHPRPMEMIPALLAFDAELKSDGVNPGTSADLTVASLFAHLLDGGAMPEPEATGG